MPSYMENPGNALIAQSIRLGLMSRSSYLVGVNNAHFTFEDKLRVVAASNAAQFILGAEKAKNQAQSYRDFRVGAVGVVGFDNEDFAVVYGANAKPVQGSDIINVHAEHTVMTAARELGHTYGRSATIPFLVIAGDLQADQQTGMESLTLPPCGVCREAFQEGDSPVTPETLILTCSRDFSTYEWFSVRALQAKYRGEQDYADETGGTQFGTRPLSLQPFVLPTEGPVRLSDYDTPELLESDTQIAAQLLAPLAQLALRLAYPSSNPRKPTDKK